MEELRGTPAAKALQARVETRIAQLRAKGISPKLAILRVGEDEDNIAYERAATKRFENTGLEVAHFHFPNSVTQLELMQLIAGINADTSISGCLMLRPLPKHLHEAELCEALSPKKDVDGICRQSLASLLTGDNLGFPPATARSVMELLNFYQIDLKGKLVAIIGRSLVVGKPLALMLLAADATPIMCHSKTAELAQLTRQADIVICAAGAAEAFDASYFRPGQTIIDVGINWDEKNQRLVGDVKHVDLKYMDVKISPVPGGVGSLTTAVLLDHVVAACERDLIRH